MLLAPVRYSAAHAAVQADLARGVAPGDWERLLAAGDVEGALEVLRATPYGAHLGDVSEPAEVERQLRRTLCGRLRLPLPYLRGAARDLLDWLARRFEVEDLTILLRGIHEGVRPARLREFLLTLEDPSGIDVEELAGAGSIAELRERLERTPGGLLYARALAHAHHEYRRQKSTFALEVALQLAYYRRLCRIAARVGGRDANWVRALVGAAVDEENVVRAFRGRLFFDLAPEAILGYMLPRGDRAGGPVIRRIATGASPYEIAEELWDGELEELGSLRDAPQAPALVALERMLARRRDRRAREALVGYTIHLGALLAHGAILEGEVGDLIALLEGKSSGWSADRIRAELVTPAGEA